jgi:hypothetical protein
LPQRIETYRVLVHRVFNYYPGTCGFIRRRRAHPETLELAALPPR